MADEGNVSTADAPPDRNAISVVTDEGKAAASAAPSDQTDESNGEASATSDTKAKSTGDDKAPAKSKDRSSSRKIRKLTRELEEARRVGDEAKAETAALAERIAELEKGTPPAPPAKPKRTDFRSDEEFGEAYAKWKSDTDAAGKPKPKPKPKPDPNADRPDPMVAEIATLKETGIKQLGDEFDEVFSDRSLPLSRAMLEFVVDSDRGPDLVMWIDENRDEARAMYDMGPARLEKKLAKIESSLPKPKAAPKAKAKEQPRGGDGKFEPKDPPPGEPVGDGDGETDPAAIREGLPMSDYAARRRAQMKRDRVR